MSTPGSGSVAAPAMIPGFVPFAAPRAARYRAAGYWTGQRLDSLLRRAATSWPDRVAVTGAGDTHTYGELDRMVDRVAGGFSALGIAPGDRILLQLPNSSRFAVTLFALLRAGAIPVLCLPAHREAELAHFAERSGAVGLVIADEIGGFDPRATAGRLRSDLPHLRHILVDGEPGPFRSLADLPTAAAPVVTTPTDSPALLLTSGGTTGLPKLIPRTHDDYVYNATASAALCGLTAEDVYLVALPAAHNFPLACPGLLGAVAVGATTVFTADPSPEAAFDAISRHRVTVTALVPELANLWAQACSWEPVTPDSLRLLQVGGAKLGAEDARRIRASLTPGLQQVFGMAEGLLNFTRLDDPDEVLECSQGRPLCADDELRIVDDTGTEVAPGEEGELLARGPYTLNGYFAEPDVNGASFTGDGFFRTGDRVRRRADGNLEVTGRVKDVILRGGETVPALAVEEHLLAHPAVRAVAVVGLPDPKLGEKVCAAVVLASASPTLADLNGHLAERGTATHLRLDAVAVLPSLPMTAVGKVDKKTLVHRLTKPDTSHSAID